MNRHVTIDTIREAAAAVYRAAVRTPLVRLDYPESDAEIYLKLETLQPIGSFKIRGAFNAVRQLAPAELAQGVWTISAGNAAQGVAFAARLAGARCAILMFDTAPDTKRRAVTRLGATIVPASYDECWQALEARASSRMQGFFVHPFDDDRFISGNGTIGLEILEDLPDVDAVIAPLGGGGLLSGIACVMRALRPEARVYAAEPATAAPFAFSLERGAPSRYPDWQASFVDGAGGKSVLPTMWPMLSTWLAGSFVVPLEEVAEAMRLTAERARVIAEGAAGCAIAAAVSDRPRRAGHRKIMAVVSGGNIDLPRFAEVIGACRSAASESRVPNPEPRQDQKSL